jgi:hypothetical protein
VFSGNKWRRKHLLIQELKWTELVTNMLIKKWQIYALFTQPSTGNHLGQAKTNAGKVM